jgi:chemotaxis response regulator CheB
MAASLGEDAIGVILSVTGHDGALGLKAIKARGGLTLAQSGEGSNDGGSGPEFPGMPDSAVAAGAVDPTRLWGRCPATSLPLGGRVS